MWIVVISGTILGNENKSFGRDIKCHDLTYLRGNLLATGDKDKIYVRRQDCSTFTYFGFLSSSSENI